MLVHCHTKSNCFKKWTFVAHEIERTEPNTMPAYSYTITNMVSNQSYQIIARLEKNKN